MSEYFCPVCDNELPGPIPLCPHCHSLTGFKPAAPVVEDAAAKGVPDEGGAVLPPPAPVAVTEPVDVVPPPVEGVAGEPAPASDPLAPPEAPDDPTVPIAAAPPAPVAVPLPPTVLGVPSAPLGTGASGPGAFRPIPQQLQPAGGGAGARFWQQPGFWKQPKVLVAGGAALVVLIIAVVVLAGGSDSKTPIAEPTSAATTIATVPETSVAETEVATTKPSTTTTSSTTSTTSTTSPPTTTTLVLALKGTDDFPGTPVTIGTALRSSLDQTSRPRELFAVTLEAGQRIRLGLQMKGGGSLALINPGALTLTQSYSTALSGSTDNNGRYTGTFVAAIAGTYGLLISAQTTAQSYRLDVDQNGIGVTALQGTDDLPGAPLAVDSTIRSVVDRDMRPREVYAVDAAAGQQLQLTLQVPGGGSLAVINPGGLSLNQAHTTAVSGGTDNKGTYTVVFNPAVTGTYSVVVTASASGESYSLKVAASKAALPAGQGTDEFPGAPLALATVVKSIVDQDTRPYEVYAVDLTAGQPIKLTVNSAIGASVQLVNPGAVSVKQSFTRALSGGTNSGKFVASFIPAISGTYSIIVTASGHGVTFDLLVEASGAAVPALTGADDVPGVPIDPNGAIQSVVDSSTRPFEVFALDLAAGQQVKITLEMPGGGSLSVANPGTTTIKGSYTRAMSGGTSSGKYVGLLVPAVSGTYSVVVQASQSGEPYSLTIGPP